MVKLPSPTGDFTSWSSVTVACPRVLKQWNDFVDFVGFATRGQCARIPWEAAICSYRRVKMIWYGNC